MIFFSNLTLKLNFYTITLSLSLASWCHRLEINLWYEIRKTKILEYRWCNHFVKLNINVILYLMNTRWGNFLQMRYLNNMSLFATGVLHMSRLLRDNCYVILEKNNPKHYYKWDCSNTSMEFIFICYVGYNFYAVSDF